MIVMRGYVGEVVFFFTLNGRVIGLELYREWVKTHTPMRPGQEYREPSIPC